MAPAVEKPESLPDRTVAASPSSEHQASPLFLLEIPDLSDPGVKRYLENVSPTEELQTAVDTVLGLLYPGKHKRQWPQTRSITLVLESFGGVAYTMGKRLDNDHKEIHFSTDYIMSIDPSRINHEIVGVLVHEMVHCWQWNGKGSAPGGLIEGFADWVRLKANLGPPHWSQRADSNWDAGYEVTAYFLEWYDEIHGGEDIPLLNARLKEAKYDPDAYWKNKDGKEVKVDELWSLYKEYLEKKAS